MLDLHLIHFMISAENITVIFKGEDSLFKDFSFHIPANSHTCFAGGSGKGKSTILKLLQAYVLPKKGIISIDNCELTPQNIYEMRGLMTYVPQNIHLPVKSGIELVKLLGIIANQSLIDEFLTELDIEPSLIFKSFDEISGGQKQRIVISVCLSLDRKIILLDEPTASLDAESNEKLIALIKRLKNKTIVSASHNPIWMKSADKIINL